MKKRKLMAFLLAGTLSLSCLSAAAVPLKAIASEEKTNWKADLSSYSISSIEDLKGFREAMAAGNTFAGKSISLEKDIELSADSDVGTLEYVSGGSFEGVFNGKGHSIKNWTKYNEALFSNIGTGGKVSNLAMSTNTTIKTGDSNPASSIVAFRNYGVISKVELSGTFTSESVKASITSFVENNPGSIENCLSSIQLTMATTNSKPAKVINCGLVNSNKGTISKSVYSGKLVNTQFVTKNKLYGIASGNVSSSYYQAVDNYQAGDGLGTPVAVDELGLASKYEGLDFTKDWTIGRDGMPHIIFESTQKTLIPVKAKVIVNDYIFNEDTTMGNMSFPISVDFEYAGTDTKMAEAFAELKSQYGLKALLKEDKINKDFKVKTPVNGQSADFAKLDPKEYFTIEFMSNDQIDFVLNEVCFEDTSATYYDNADAKNNLSDEEKAAKVADMEKAAKKIIDLCYEAHGSKCTRDPFLAFTCGRLDYYPGGLTKDDFYRGLLEVFEEYAEYVSSKGERPETTECSKYVLGLTAMGFDARQFGKYNMIDQLLASDDNGKYFAEHYLTFALYSGRYGDYESHAKSLVSKVYGSSKKDSCDAEDMPVMHMQPIGLFYDKNATPDNEEAYKIKVYVETEIIPWMKNSVTGFGNFNSIYTNGSANVWTDAQAHMLLALVGADFLSEDFVHNGRTIVDYIIEHPDSSLGYLNDQSQCARGLMSLIRAYKGQTLFFDCSDIKGTIQLQNMIDNMPEAVTADMANDIKEMTDIYNSFSDEQKKQVKNYDKLTVAKETLLKLEDTDKNLLDDNVDNNKDTVSDDDSAVLGAVMPNTGDTTNIMLLVFLMLLAGGTIFTIRYKKMN